MSYTAIEASVSDGQVVELYEFLQGSTYYRYCTTVAAVTYGSPQATYTGAPITRTRVTQSGDPFKNNISITFPRTNTFAASFIDYAVDDVTTLTIYRGHVDDNDFDFYWKGRVVSAECTDNAITLECESVFTSINRPGLTAKMEITCRHTLYADACGVDKSSFAISATISTITDGVDITASIGMSPLVDGYFTGGMLLYNGNYRFITTQTGGTFTISRPLEGLAASASVTLYPGCDHSKSVCINTFNNLVNFGGFPWIPTRSPLNGKSIV